MGTLQGGGLQAGSDGSKNYVDFKLRHDHRFLAVHNPGIQKDEQIRKMNEDERHSVGIRAHAGNLTLPFLLNKVVNCRKNLCKNIVLAHLNRKPSLAY